MLLSKSEYILWRDCPHTAWLKKRRRAIYDQCAGAGLSDFERALAETGNQVEEHARRLYPGGQLVDGRGNAAVELTSTLLAQRKPVLFQAALTNGTLFVAVDILLVNPTTGALSVLEVKATTEDKKPKKNPDTFLADRHIQDLGFQVSLLQRLGYTVERAAIMHLNKDYVRTGELDLRALFVEDDVTEFLIEWMPAIDADIAKAVAFMSDDAEPMARVAASTAAAAITAPPLPISIRPSAHRASTTSPISGRHCRCCASSLTPVSCRSAASQRISASRSTVSYDRSKHTRAVRRFSTAPRSTASWGGSRTQSTS